MARTYDLERADTGRPGAQDRQAKAIERRRRNTAMGTGSGSDFCDGAMIPTTLGGIQTPFRFVTKAFRFIHKHAIDTDDRIELLTTILGEAGNPMKDQFKIEVTEADDGH